MTAKENIQFKEVITKSKILNATQELKIGRSKFEQIEAVLCIAVTNKLSLLPFVCTIISEQSEYYYSECADHFADALHLTDEDRITLHLRPDIKDYIDKQGHQALIDDYNVCQSIDRAFSLEHPKEKISYLYYMAKKGSVYAQLSAGSRISRLDEDPDFLFNMPVLARAILREGIDNLKQTQRKNISIINSSMKSLIVEAYVKYINSSMDCGFFVTDLIEEISWLTNNYPNHHRWLKIIAQTKELNDIFNNKGTDLKGGSDLFYQL